MKIINFYCCKKLEESSKSIKNEIFETMANKFTYNENLVSLIKTLEDVSNDQKKQVGRFYII